MNDTTTKMRELLARWAEVEPGRCKREDWPSGERILILTPSGGWQLVWDEEETGGYYPTQPAAEAFTQWLVQQAIIERGWVFELKYNPDCPDLNNSYDATVDSNKSGGWSFGNDGFTVPLLEAYLHTLEATK